MHSSTENQQAGRQLGGITYPYRQGINDPIGALVAKLLGVSNKQVAVAGKTTTTVNVLEKSSNGAPQLSLVLTTTNTEAAA